MICKIGSHADVLVGIASGVNYVSKNCNKMDKKGPKGVAYTRSFNHANSKHADSNSAYFQKIKNSKNEHICSKAPAFA